MVTLDFVDTLLILTYAAAVVFIGIRASRRAKPTTDDFLLAGRTLTLPMFVATLVSTWYGGILGVGEFSYRYGLSNWVVFGAPYYLFGLVFALVLAKRIRSTNLMTIPDKLEASYDRRTAILGSVLTFLLVTPAAYVLMLGVLVHLVFGVTLVSGILIATFVTVCYLYAGGFRSGVWTNVFEFIMMFLGFFLIVGFAVSTYGGLEFIRDHVPTLHLTWHGGNSWQYIGVWFFIGLWTLVDPSFHQRCYAAKDGTTAQRGILVSLIFWFLFDFLTTTSGLYARAVLPALSDPMFSYPMLAEVALPVVAKGLFYIGLLATIMSTVSSTMFIAASTIGNDIVGRFVSSTSKGEIVQRWTKRGLILSGGVAVGLAVLVPSVVNLWYTIGTCIIPGLLVPLLASYFERLRIPAKHAFYAMLAGWLVSTGSLVVGQLNTAGGVPEYWLGVEPMVPGLAAAVAVWGIGRLRILANQKKIN